MEKKLYPEVENVCQLIELMKEYHIQHCVLSPGASCIPIVHTLEMDSYFNCYSMVDERNAAFFALGLSQSLKQPVAICCTTGTASANYYPGICEAFFQKIPLLVITADRSGYYEYQMMDQKIPQHKMYQKVTRKSVTLPIIKDDIDRWYCQRLLNEALSSLDYRDPGPVHINVPVDRVEKNDRKEWLIKKIVRIRLNDRKYQNEFLKLTKRMRGKRVLIIYGQSIPVSCEEKQKIERFADRFNCVIMSEHISNLYCKWSLNSYLLCVALNKETFRKLKPDIVISVGGQYLSSLRGLLEDKSLEFEHWCVNQNGDYIDHLKKLTCVIESDTESFFDKFGKYGQKDITHEYYEAFCCRYNLLPKADFAFSNNYAIARLIETLPSNSLLHLGIDSIVRLADCLKISNTVSVYSNRGTTGIDGSLSTFVGQSCNYDGLCFLIIGDLSFFYNMNGLWHPHMKSNMRILLCNNGGGETFYWNDARNIETKDRYIAAAHNTNAKGWIKSLGFEYLEATNQQEFERGLEELVKPVSDRPILMELFTDKAKDASIMLEFFLRCKAEVNGWGERLKKYPRCLIFGTGIQAEYVTGMVEKMGGKVVAYCDSAKEKEGTIFLSKPVWYTPQIKENSFLFDQIVISSEKHYIEMRDMLERMGFSKEKYFLLS